MTTSEKVIKNKLGLLELSVPTVGKRVTSLQDHGIQP